MIPFRKTTNAIARTTLISHLGYHLMLNCCFCHFTNFVQIMSQRFLYIYVFASLHSIHCHHIMRVVRCGNGNCINAFFLVEHFAEILINFRIWKFLCHWFDVSIVHITNDGNVFRAIIPSSVHINHSFTTHAHASNVQFIGRGNKTLSAQHMTGNNIKTARNQRSLLNKISP